MKRLVIGVLLAILLPLGLSAQRGRPQRRGIPAYYQALEAIEDEGTRGRVVLRNGLRVLVDEYSIRPLAAVVSAFHIGKAQEKPEESGWAEEVGRRLWLAGELNQQIRELGGWNEVDAGLYDTAFISIAPAENLEGVLGLHSQLLGRKLEESAPPPVLPLPLPLGLLQMRLWTEAFGETGPESSTAPAAVALQAFRDRHFHVGNLVLGVSGNVLRTQVYERVVALYGRLKAGQKTARPASNARPGPGFAYVHLRGAGTSQRLLMGYRVPSEGHVDSTAIEMAEALLAAGRGSLLQRTQVAGGFSAQATAELRQDRRGRLLEVSLSPRDGKVDSAEIGVLGLLNHLARQGPPEADLVRARSRLVAEYFEKLQRVRERALGMSRAELAGSHKEFWDRPRKLAGIGATQIKAVAARYFNQSNLVLVEHFPESGEIRNFDAPTLQQTFELLLAPQQEKIAQELATTPTIEAQDLAFADFKPVLLDPPLKRTSVLRGPDIYLEEEHTVPLVSAGFYYPGGRSDETAENQGITELLLRGLLAGVEKRNGLAVWMPFEARGARFELVNSPEYFGIQVTVLADAFAPLLKDVVGWFQDPLIDPEDFERVRAEVMALLDQAQADPAARTDQAVRSALFPGHPYGGSRFGSVTSLRALSAEEVQNWAVRQLGGFHPFIVIRGHVNGTSFLPPLVPILSNSKLRVKQGATLPEGKEGFVATREGNRLVVGFHGPKRGSFDAWALDVLESLLELRDGVLPADASLPQLGDPVTIRHQSFFSDGTVSVSVQDRSPGKGGEVQSKLLKLLAELERAPLPESEVLRAMVLSITRFHVGQQDSASLLRELAHNLLAGEKVGYREEYLASIKGLQPADLRSLAGRIFSVAGKPGGEESPR